MTNLMRLLCAVALGVLSPVTSFAQSQGSPLSGYRYAVVPLQTFGNGKVDPYGLGKRLRERIAADTSWKLLADVEVTPTAVGFSWPAELSWQTVAASDSIAQDRIKLAQTALLSIATPGGRGRMEVSVVVSDILGRQLARFEGVSGVLGRSTGRKMLDALDKAIALLSQARPQFIAKTAATEKVMLDEAQMRSYLASAPELSPIEGMWSDRDNTFRIAIKREQGTPQFIAVVLSSKHPFWESGMVKARFEPTADPAVLLGHYGLDDHQEQLVMFRVERSALVSQSGGLDVTFVRVDTGDVRPSAPEPPPF